ncbi:uncharacterized protein LOC118456804 [Anopheles albimanus]|uniref:uncharacterized protein LOC118456804 n=1 Tax=Anopheles albimanus TaxID=7167 RepID=UPI00163E775E|nr:uncharacterized protein LOC118456804 [Anopheles albimanus]
MCPHPHTHAHTHAESPGSVSRARESSGISGGVNHKTVKPELHARGYRGLVRKYLWYVHNLHNPYGMPPSEGAIDAKLRQFTRIPVPRTADEMEAQREERLLLERARQEQREARRSSSIVCLPRYTYYPLREKPEKPFLFNWKNWFWP